MQYQAGMVSCAPELSTGASALQQRVGAASGSVAHVRLGV